MTELPYPKPTRAEKALARGISAGFKLAWLVGLAWSAWRTADWRSFRAGSGPPCDPVDIVAVYYFGINTAWLALYYGFSFRCWHRWALREEPRDDNGSDDPSALL